MEHRLQTLFERALDNEPASPPEGLARSAMVRGARLRRRRTLLTAGAAAAVVAAVVTTAALVPAEPAGEATPTVTAPAAMLPPLTEACRGPAYRVGFDIRIYLRPDATDQQRADLDAALRSDPRVRDVRFRSREQAYATFVEAFRNSPDLVAAVTVDQFPQAFEVELAKQSDYPVFATELKDVPAVDEIHRTPCPTTSRPGERQ